MHTELQNTCRGPRGTCRVESRYRMLDCENAGTPDWGMRTESIKLKYVQEYAGKVGEKRKSWRSQLVPKSAEDRGSCGHETELDAKKDVEAWKMIRLCTVWRLDGKTYIINASSS